MSIAKTSRMLLATSTFPVFDGDGRPRFVLDLARALKSHFEVEVLTPHVPGAAVLEVMDGVKVRRFRYFLPASLEKLTAGDGVSANLRESWLARLQAPLFMVAQVFALWRALVRSRPAVVNCHWLVPQGLSTALVKVFKDFPLVLHVHAGDVYLLRRVPFGGAIARFVVARSNHIYVDGSHVRDSLDLLLGYESGAELRPMGVWTREFSSKEVDERKRHRLVFVGRLVEKKGVIFLLQAMALLAAEYPDVHLTIIGDGPLREPLTAETRSLEIADRVDFTGPLSHGEVIKRLRSAGVACVPSIIDSRGETEGDADCCHRGHGHWHQGGGKPGRWDSRRSQP